MLWIPSDRLVERLVRCLLGLAVFAFGVALIIHAELGPAPWDVLHDGLARITGLAIGTVLIIVGGLLLLLWIPLRERPGLGTVLNAVAVGTVVNVSLALLPHTDRLVPRVAMMLGGILLVAIGSGAYIGSGLGPGPRDGLMTGLARLGMSIRVARTSVELSVVAGGLALGGSIGVGTALFALGIGPLVQVFLPRLTVTTPEATPAPALPRP